MNETEIFAIVLTMENMTLPMDTFVMYPYRPAYEQRLSLSLGGKEPDPIAFSHLCNK